MRASWVLFGGWLASALASTDEGVDAGIDAYEAREYDEAISHFREAKVRLGERRELDYNEGITLARQGDREGAQAALKRAAEGAEPSVRASAAFALGNLELAAEAYDAAIEHYIACLKVRPDHQAAKWNLEIAIARRDEAKDEEQEDEPESQDTDGEPEHQDTDGEPQGTGGEPPPPEGTGEDGDEEDPSTEQGTAGESPEAPQDQNPTDEGETGGDAAEAPQPSPQDEGQEGGEEAPPPPAADSPGPDDATAIDRALEQLDEEDRFGLGQPGGRRRPPAQDW